LTREMARAEILASHRWSNQ